MIDMFELNHQENGLNEIGWKLLPKSCSYIDDKEIVKDLVDRGGVCDNFIRHLINEQTVFHTWWENNNPKEDHSINRMIFFSY